MEGIMVTQAAAERMGRDPIRLAAVLLLTGILVTAIAGLLHPEGADANDHPAIFVLDAVDGIALWLNRFALVTAGAAMALYAVLQAVDGVGLKHAVDAWASAQPGDKAVRFDAAETIRWLEWAVSSYHSFVFGLALLMFGLAIALLHRIPRPIGYLMTLSGACYLIQGLIIGTSGFSSANQIPTLLGIALIVAWTVWLLIAALKKRTTARPRTTPAAPV